jgi:hypothetical protein
MHTVSVSREVLNQMDRFGAHEKVLANLSLAYEQLAFECTKLCACKHEQCSCIKL